MHTEETFQQEYESHLTEVYLQELNKQIAESDINPKPLPDSYDWATLMAWGKENFGRDVWAMMIAGATNKRNSEEGKLRSIYFKVEQKPKTKVGVGITHIPEELIDHIVEGVMEANNGGIDWEQTFRWTVEDEGAEDGTNHFEIRTNEVTYVIKEENDYKGPLEYGSKTLRKIQKLVREEMR